MPNEWGVKIGSVANVSPTRSKDEGHKKGSQSTPINLPTPQLRADPEFVTRNFVKTYLHEKAKVAASSLQAIHINRVHVRRMVVSNPRIEFGLSRQRMGGKLRRGIRAKPSSRKPTQSQISYLKCSSAGEANPR